MRGQHQSIEVVHPLLVELHSELPDRQAKSTLDLPVVGLSLEPELRGEVEALDVHVVDLEQSPPDALELEAFKFHMSIHLANPHLQDVSVCFLNLQVVVHELWHEIAERIAEHALLKSQEVISILYLRLEIVESKDLVSAKAQMGHVEGIKANL